MKSRFSEEQIIGLLKQHEAGVSAAQLCRDNNVSQPTFYKWKAKYGGMNVDEAKRLKQFRRRERPAQAHRGGPGTGHRRSQGRLIKKLVKPAAKRKAVHHMQEQHGLSQRRACELTGCNRGTARHISQRQDDPALRERMKQLADENRAWGYRLLCGKLHLEGFRVNHKRAHRIYREEKLALRPRKRKRLQGEKRGHPPAPTKINEVWTMDFVSDALQNGRPFRTLNILDAFTRQCHCIEVDTSLGGYRVVRVLDQLIRRHGTPRRLQIDNGPEFRCKPLEDWARRNGVELYFIDPGKPNQNNRIESFNSRFREECLNQEWFLSLAEARYIIERWRRHYNSVRPHSSLKYLPPNEWARQQLAQQLAQDGPEASCNVILPVPILTSRGTADAAPCSASFGSNH